MGRLPRAARNQQRERQRAAVYTVLAHGRWMSHTAIQQAAHSFVPLSYTTLQAVLLEARRNGEAEARRVVRHGTWEWRLVSPKPTP